MNRLRLLLNLLLLAALVVSAYELRRRWLDARAREATILAASRPAPAPPAAPAPAPPAAPAPARPADYFEVAEKFLFSRDRNPSVVEEKKPEPPPKVMPNFPAVYGVMDIGMGPIVFMAADGGAQQGYRLGEKIGEFVLKAASQDEITFEWDGKDITKSLDELRAKPDAPVAPRAAAPLSASAAAPVAPPPKPPENIRPAPGPDIGGGRRGCLPGDNSPAGTVVDGYKKVAYNYAFGPICFWESTR
jgi:hypothetical protein